jgi:hypothetical protein
MRKIVNNIKEIHNESFTTMKLIIINLFDVQQKIHILACMHAFRDHVIVAFV